MAASTAMYSTALQLHRSPPLPLPANATSPRSVQIARSKRRGMISVASMSDNRVDMVDNPEGIISGEWPENFSLLSYDDLRSFLVPQICRDKMCPSAKLGKMMETDIPLATTDQGLGEIRALLETVPAIPVVDDDCRCVGIITKADIERLGNEEHTCKAGEIMSSPVVTLTSEKTVMDAAALMLKKKVHKIPILNENRQVIGMVTRTDVFQCLQPEEVCFNF